MENKFSKYLTGFRKSCNTQHCRLKITESWNAQLNIGTKVGAIIINLARAFVSLKDLATISLSFSVAIFRTDINVVK